MCHFKHRLHLPCQIKKHMAEKGRILKRWQWGSMTVSRVIKICKKNLLNQGAQLATSQSNSHIFTIFTRSVSFRKRPQTLQNQEVFYKMRAFRGRSQVATQIGGPTRRSQNVVSNRYEIRKPTALPHSSISSILPFSVVLSLL